MTEVEWKPIAGFEGLYSISRDGRVRSEERNVLRGDGKTQHVPERLMSICPDSKGYLRVNLFRDKKGHTVYIHQALMRSFVGPQPSWMQVRHLDGDKLNNSLSNLKYGTDSENKQDAIRHGTFGNTAKTHCKRGHEFTPENTYRWSGNNARVCIACRKLRDRGSTHDGL